jgi:hypothetical protein
VRRLERQAYQSLSSAEDKSAWRCTSTRRIRSWRTQGKFPFTCIALNECKTFSRNRFMKCFLNFCYKRKAFTLLLLVGKQKRTVRLCACYTIVRQKAKQADILVAVSTCVRAGGGGGGGHPFDSRLDCVLPSFSTIMFFFGLSRRCLDDDSGRLERHAV